ncbi:MAG TPA: lasso peptide biosynthesis B2 protein [Thermoanaerobaculia bacterium]
MTTVEIWVTVVRTWLALRLWPERELAYALHDGNVGRGNVGRGFSPPPGRGGGAPAPEGGGLKPRPTLLAAEFRRVTRPIARGRCLHLSVACIRFLRRRGLPASLRVGFTPELRGHAWIDCDPDAFAERFPPFHVTAAGLAAFVANRRTI